MISFAINPDCRKQTIDEAARGQVVGDDVPMIESLLDLKSGARVELVDR